MMCNASASRSQGKQNGFVGCISVRKDLFDASRGWRGRAPRQPGQVRKEAAATSPAWVDVQPLTFSQALEICNRPHACGASIFAKMKSGPQRPTHLCVCFNRAGSLFTQARQSGFAVCPQFDHKTQDGHSRSPTSAKTMDQNTTAL